MGTSPLYVLNGIWPPDRAVPSKEDIIGGISAIIWALTLLPLIKYVIFECLVCLVDLAKMTMSGVHIPLFWN